MAEEIFGCEAEEIFGCEAEEVMGSTAGEAVCTAGEEVIGADEVGGCSIEKERLREK